MRVPCTCVFSHGKEKTEGALPTTEVGGLRAKRKGHAAAIRFAPATTYLIDNENRLADNDVPARVHAVAMRPARAHEQVNIHASRVNTDRIGWSRGDSEPH
jgi:hypothetical protein